MINQTIDKRNSMKKSILNICISLALAINLAACSTPEEKAEKYYQKGMALLDSNPDKAKLEFQNALQVKKNLTKAMYGLALVSERKGEWRTAFALLNQVVEQEPNHLEALVKSGQILLAGDKLDIALKRSNKALEVDKNNVGALNLRAAIQLKLNDDKGAVEYANLALAKDPKNQDSFVVLATERLHAKDEQKALEFLDKALAINEKNLAVQMIKIRTLESMLNLVEAEKNYKKIITLFPQTAFVRKSYAQFLLKNNRKEEAEQQLRLIVQALPNDLQAKLDVVRYVVATKGNAAGQTTLETYVKNEPANYELAFSLVNLYQAQGNSNLEDKMLIQIAEKAGNAQEGYKAKGLMAVKLVRAGKKAEATKMIEAILQEDKRNEQALMLRANLAMQAKNYDAAIVDLRTILRDSPEASGAALMLANAHESSGSPELAEEHYLKAFQSSKFSPNFGLPYSNFLIRRKQPERAEKVLEDMLAHNPGNTPVLRALAQVKIARGDNPGAQAIADQVKKSGDKTLVADEIMGAIAISKNDFEGTISAFKHAHQSNPDQVQPVVAIVRTYMSAGKTQQAIEFTESALKANPNNFEVKVLLGQLYSSVADITKASQVFNEIIKTQPNNPVGYQQLAVAQQRAKQNEAAEKTVDLGLTVAPKDFGLMFTKAGVYESTGRYDNAITVYENMLKIRPDSELVINNLASLLTDYRTDKASYDRAYEASVIFKNSQTPQFLDTFGWASYKAGKLDEATKALKKANELQPETAIYRYHLGKVLFDSQHLSDAKQELQKAVKLSATQPFEQLADAKSILNTL